MIDKPPVESEPALGPTARRMVLGNQLRRLRERAGLSRAEAANSIRGSESKISRLELGRVSFKERDVIDLLTAYQVTDVAERKQFVEMVNQSNQVGWWHLSSSYAQKRWLDTYIGLEEATSQINCYQLQFVPGLLQSEEYARAVISHGRHDLRVDEVERAVNLLMRRQHLLTRRRPFYFSAVLDESVLYRRFGGDQVFRFQLDRLLELTQLPNVTLQIMNFAESSRVTGGFVLLQFQEEELPDIVYLEHEHSATYLEKSEDVAHYRQAWKLVTAHAQTPDESRRTLDRVRTAL